MITIDRFFENQFDDKNISRQALRKFAEDHLQRLAVQNTNNLYDDLLNNTETAYESYFGALTDRDTSFALQQSRTKSMNNVVGNFQATLRLREGLVSNYFPKDTPEYQEFFPANLDEYNRATLLNAETLMSRIVTAFTAHTATFGANTVTEFTNFLTQFKAARGTQLLQKGKVSDASENTEATRTILEIQLTTNVLSIALKNIGKPQAAASFFDQSILAGKGSDGGGDEKKVEEGK
jgi:hypothetical protein